MSKQQADRTETELWYLPYSPWSEKARWALDVLGVPYRKRIYQPLIGELGLRALVKRPRGRVSVPVLRTASGAIAESLDIARYAGAHARAQGSRIELFPAGRERDIARYDALSEAGLSAGRARALQRLLEKDSALAELVPPVLRAGLGKLAPRLAAMAIRRTLRKYEADRVSESAHERVLGEALDALRADLKRSTAQAEPKTLLEHFSYADITMAQILAFIEPPKLGLRIGTETRETFRDPVFGPRYADLIAWRDELYEKYRRT
ncbi:MAG: glutathione S-transferase N-terminal domain-containing protein [Myxococcales bacterium]